MVEAKHGFVSKSEHWGGLGRMSYVGLREITSAEEGHLGGNIREGDPFTYSPRAWDYVLDRFAIRSILDLGSGLGYSSQYFFQKGRQVIAVDGLVENCAAAVYPTLKHDLNSGPVFCSVDLVHCQEVVEHIEEQYLDHVLASLACGKFVLVTHAMPGQGGHHHVNLKPPEYWRSNMARFECEVMEEDTKRLRKLAQADGASYLASTGLLFANKRR